MSDAIGRDGEPLPRPRVRRPGSSTTRLRGPRTLRGRAALAFTAVAAVLITVLCLGVWYAVSGYLLIDRARSTLAQTSANAAQVQRALSQEGVRPADVLSQLRRENGSTSLLLHGGAWITSSLQVGRADLPIGLRRMVVSGTAASQRFFLDGHPVLAVGEPLDAADDAYFEVFPLDELDHTYKILSVVLAGAGTTAVALFLVIGWWATRPALRPLERVSDAAAAIAGGDLQARLDAGHDPALAPIAESFNTTAAALESRVRADARFAADVSHELRSPLTTMLMAIGVVEAHQDRLPEDGREGVELLRSELIRFERLVADLLEISRTDAGDVDVELESVNLAALVREALARRSAGGLCVPPVTVDAPAAAVSVRADKRRLERVISNLVDNADKHGGGVSAVRVETGGSTACVVVDDDGPGVPPEDRHRIFERFTRGTGSGAGGPAGAGLGLSLVDRHVRAMGGAVDVTDSPSGGARFVVRLPLEEGS